MINLGMKRLREAALDSYRVCSDCGSDAIEPVGAGPGTNPFLPLRVRCRNCGAVERAEDTTKHLQEALDIFDGRTAKIASKEHIDALVGHCEGLYLRIAELEEILAAERSRMAAMRNEEPVYA